MSLSMTDPLFDDEDTDLIDPAQNPAMSNATIASVLAVEKQEAPSIPNPTDGFVSLPGGLVLDGKVYRELEVRELTGAHEERLAKTRQSSGQARWYNTLLECGVVSVGGRPAEDVLDALLIGDREYLLLAIRSATYGDDIEMGEGSCPQCGGTFELTLQTEDIPVKRLRSAKEIEFEVPLRKGGKALVRLPNGADQTAYLEDADLTDSERNTVLLTRCILDLPMNGEQTPVAAYPSLVRELGVVDRRKILNQIADRMPGPRYDEVEFEHDCGAKIPASLGLVSLFPGL